MKILIPFFLIITIADPSFASNNYDEPRFTFGFYTGPVIPAGSERLTDYWGIGFITGIQTGVFVHKRIQLRSTIDYNQFSFRRQRFRDDNNFPEDQYLITNNVSSVVNLSASAVYYLPVLPYKQMNLYTGISAGIMYVEIGDINVSENDQELTVTGTSKSGFELGFSCGLEMRFWPATSLFSELGYWYGFTPRTNTRIVPLKLGVNVYL